MKLAMPHSLLINTEKDFVDLKCPIYVAKKVTFLYEYCPSNVHSIHQIKQFKKLWLQTLHLYFVLRENYLVVFY